MSKNPDDDMSAAGTTIVGGQPQGRRPRRRARIPVGIEKVLYLAATEPEFRGALLRERLSAVEARGLELLQSEQAMLRAAPTAQLEAAIDGLDLSAHNLERRRFMRTVAAAAVTLAAGEALSGCEINEPQAGIAADVPIQPNDAGGARPDVPESDAEPLDREAFPEASPAGISPDVPTLDVAELDHEAFPRDASAGVDASPPPDVEVHYMDAGGARPDAPEED